MGRLEGKVALVTGAARGQGRAHAIRFAKEGADVIGVDLVAPVSSVPYDMPEPAQLAETAELVKQAGGRMLARQVDVRDQAGLDDVVTAGLEQFGHIDVVVANAGIYSWGSSWEQSEAQWQDMLDINLTGVWHTVKATVPAMIGAGNGGSIILTSSILGLRGALNSSSYSAAKHGVIGLAKSLAIELGPHRIRVNTVNPSNVATDMILNPALLSLFCPDLEQPTRDDVAEVMAQPHPLGVPWVESADVSDAVLFLASQEARYITGISLPVDAGLLAR